MRIAPTLDGGLRIDAESAHDWLLLEMICTDAASLSESPLTERLAAHMETNEDWDEYVTPDLKTQFSEQIAHVSRAISIAEKDHELVGHLHIQKSEADTWFGAINQARLSLEAQYQLSNYQHPEEIDDQSPFIQSTFARYELYSQIQFCLLEYLMN